MKLLIIFALLAGLNERAFALAACSSTAPVGTCNASIAGKVAAGSGATFYCTGTSWRSLAGPPVSGSTCTANGLAYDKVSHTLRFCCLSSGVYFQIGGTTTPDPCTAADEGKIIFASNTAYYCNGSVYKSF